jgi:hypothetical protein
MNNRNIISLVEEWSAAVDQFLKTSEGTDLLQELKPWEREVITILVRSLVPLPEDAQPLLALEADGFKASIVKIVLEKLEFRYHESATKEEDAKSDLFFLQAMADKLARAVSRFVLLHGATSGKESGPRPPTDRPTMRVDPLDPLFAIDEPGQYFQEERSDHATVPAPPDYEKLTQRSALKRSGLYTLALDVRKDRVIPVAPIVNQVSVRPAIPPPSLAPREPSPFPKSDVSHEPDKEEEESNPGRTTPFMGDILSTVAQVTANPEPSRSNPDQAFNEAEITTSEIEVDPADIQAWEKEEIDQTLNGIQIPSRPPSSKDGHS